MRNFVLIALLSAITPYASAQRMISAAPHFAAAAHHRWAYPLGFFSSPFYDDALASYPAVQPPMIILQSPPMAEAIPDRSIPSSPPLMIELQGDRYVRVSGEENSSAETIEEPVQHVSSTLSRPSQQSASPHALDPVVLIFRDGHREEVSEYTIADGILYARADFYTDGSWNKKIALSSLDLPETMRQNQASSAHFRLPAAPNEVITRP